MLRKSQGPTVLELLRGRGLSYTRRTTSLLRGVTIPQDACVRGVPCYKGAMPIFEYECRACGHAFEQLVRTGDVPACPDCQAQDLEKLVSLSSVSSPAIRQANVKKAREATKGVQREKAVAEMDEIREHYGEHAVRKPEPLRKK